MSDVKTQTLNQFLTFTLGEDLFALDIGSVREILDDTAVTPVPRTPPFMRGVINLRGHAVPVVDMRQKFGMAPTQFTVDTCIIITEVDIEGESAVIGALADSVQEVVELGDLEPAPKMGAAVDTRFIRAMGKQGERFVMILDVDHVFGEGELDMVVAAGADAPASGDTLDAGFSRMEVPNGANLEMDAPQSY